MTNTEDQIDPRHPAELRRLADLQRREGEALLEAARRLEDLVDSSSWIQNAVASFIRDSKGHLDHARRLEEVLALKGGWPQGA